MDWESSRRISTTIRPDIYVANDGDPNQLWTNQRTVGLSTMRSSQAPRSTEMVKLRLAWASMQETSTATAPTTSS